MTITAEMARSIAKSPDVRLFAKIEEAAKNGRYALIVRVLGDGQYRALRDLGFKIKYYNATREIEITWHDNA